MSFARHRRRIGGLPLRRVRRVGGTGSHEAIDVVDDPGRGIAEQGVRHAVGIAASKKSSICLRPRSAVKPVSESPRFSVTLPITAVPATRPSASKLAAARLPLGSVRQCRLQHAIVIDRGHRVADGVRGAHDQQIVPVVVDRRGLPNGSTKRRGMKKCRRASASSCSGAAPGSVW